MLVVVGCGGGDPKQPAPPSFDPVPGPRLAGELVFECGRSMNETAMLSLQGGALRRLTELGRITAKVAGVQVELSPQVARRGEQAVAFTSLDEHSSGLLWDEVFVKRLGSKRRQVAEFRHVWQLDFVGGRLDAGVGEKRRCFLVQGVGTAGARRTRLRTDNAVHIARSRSGRGIYTDARRGPVERVHVMSPSGPHVRSFATEWAPKAWSRDERQVLATRGSELGLMDPSTGSVRPFGKVACGHVSFAEWR